MENKPTLLLVVLFFAGCTSMMYEVVLIREMAIILGPTELASALVLAAFMAGLALGAYYLGKEGETRAPLSLLFGIQAALSSIGLALLPAIRSIKALDATGIVFALSFCVLIIPAFFMGGEIPLVSKILAQDRKTSKWVGMAYAADTFGGIIGSLGAGIILLPLLGSFRIFLIGSGLNILGAAIVLYVKGKT